MFQEGPLVDKDSKTSTLFGFDWTMLPCSLVHLTTIGDHDPEAKKDGKDDVLVEYGDHIINSAPDVNHVPPPKEDHDFEKN